MVNVVLLDNASRLSTTVETTARRWQDGQVDPGGQISVAGANNSLDYIFNFKAAPGYRYWDSEELTYNDSGNLIGTETQKVNRDEDQYAGNVNLGFNMERSVFKVNGLFEERGDSPTDRRRITTEISSNNVREQSDLQNTTRSCLLYTSPSPRD